MPLVCQKLEAVLAIISHKEEEGAERREPCRLGLRAVVAECDELDENRSRRCAVRSPESSAVRVTLDRAHEIKRAVEFGKVRRIASVDVSIREHACGACRRSIGFPEFSIHNEEDRFPASHIRWTRAVEGDLCKARQLMRPLLCTVGHPELVGVTGVGGYKIQFLTQGPQVPRSEERRWHIDELVGSRHAAVAGPQRAATGRVIRRGEYHPVPERNRRSKLEQTGICDREGSGVCAVRAPEPLRLKQVFFEEEQQPTRHLQCMWETLGRAKSQGRRQRQGAGSRAAAAPDALVVFLAGASDDEHEIAAERRELGGAELSPLLPIRLTSSVPRCPIGDPKLWSTKQMTCHKECFSPRKDQSKIVDPPIAVKAGEADGLLRGSVGGPDPVASDEQEPSETRGKTRGRGVAILPTEIAEPPGPRTGAVGAPGPFAVESVPCWEKDPLSDSGEAESQTIDLGTAARAACEGLRRRRRAGAGPDLPIEGTSRGEED